MNRCYPPDGVGTTPWPGRRPGSRIPAMRRRLMLMTTAALALGATGLAEAHQTTGPGANGRMIIASDRPGSVASDIWSINPDGSDPVNISKSHGTDLTPVISPDGTKIAFTSLRLPKSQDYDVFVMDRSEERRVGKECRSRWS